MNAQRLLQHFSRIAEAPDAVPRLRRFILDLAVRGKLAKQDPKDEPASELLKRIEEDVGNRRPSSAISEPRTAIEIPIESLPFDVPDSWRWARLIRISEVSYGFAFESSRFNSRKIGMPLIRIRDISGMDAEAYYEGDFDQAYIVRKGDYLVGMDGDFNVRKWKGPDALLNQRVMRVKNWRAELAADFLTIPLQMILDHLHTTTSQTTVKHLSAKQANGIYLPLPPLAEQNRIVAKVDELMALCDCLEAAQVERESRRDRLVAASIHRLNNGADAESFREHARFYLRHLPRLTIRPEHIQQLRQTILNLAARGQLVPQDPNDEPASELLKQIQAENARLVKEGTIKRLQPVLPIDVAEISSAVPDGWQWVRVSDLLLGDSQNGYSKKPDDALDGIPILRISAGTVRKDGIVAEEEHKLIGGVSATQQEQYQLQPGDLLACRFNGNRRFVGRLSLYLGYLGIKPIYPDKLIRLRLLSQFVLPGLVRCFTESSAIRRDIESYCATTVGNWGISASNLKDVKIPLPPIAEQHRIVAKVDELMALCDHLEAQLCTTEADSRRLLEAVLHEAVAPALKETA